MEFLSNKYENTLRTENRLSPVNYNFDEEIMPRMKERSRFKEVTDFIDRMGYDIDNDYFSSIYTHHYFIHCSELNDGVVTAIAICNMIYRKYSYENLSPYLVNRTVLNEAQSAQASNGASISNNIIFDCSCYEENDDDEDEIIVEEEDASLFLYTHKNHEQIFRFDHGGTKISIIIYAENLLKNSSGLSARQAANSLGYTYLNVADDSRNEFIEYIDNEFVNYGFNTKNVQKEIKTLADIPYIKNEITAKIVARNVINSHIKTYGETTDLKADDFHEYLDCTEHKPTKNRINLIGLNNELKTIESVVNTLTLDIERRKLNITPDISGCNMVFAGPPGTAKTTLAREFAGILSERKIIPSINNFRECVKSDIVGQYVGQTAKQVDNMFRELSDNGGGVIFFDEIYSLSEADNTCYDKEAITCITQNMENYRSKIFCIFAGYENKMKEFLSSNTGLSSRISTTIKFNRYDNETLCKIFDSFVKNNKFKINGEYKDTLIDFFNSLKDLKGETFGNGREARNLFENAKRIMSERVCSKKKYTKELLTTINTEEIKIAADEILNSVIEQKEEAKKVIGFGI